MANVSCTFATSDGVRHVEVSAEGALTTVNASSLCRAVRDHLEMGAHSFLINLENVKAVDAVGLAALLQSVRLAERLGLGVTITPGPAAYRALLATRLVSELPLASSEDPTPLLLPGSPVYEIPASQRLFVARNHRLGLRLPALEDLTLFEQWAHEPLLDQMVGSDFLYLCRILGAPAGPAARRCGPRGRVRAPLQHPPPRAVRLPRDGRGGPPLPPERLGDRGLAPPSGLRHGHARPGPRGGEGVRLQPSQHQCAQAERLHAGGRPPSRAQLRRPALGHPGLLDPRGGDGRAAEAGGFPLHGVLDRPAR